MRFRLWLRATALECRSSSAAGTSAPTAGPPTGSWRWRPSRLCVSPAGAAPRDTPSGAARERERAELVRRGLADLPADDRKVLLLRVYEGLSNAEAAAVLGLYPDATSKRFARALVRLRKEFVRLGLTGSTP